MVKMLSITIILNLIATVDIKVEQMNVMTTFLMIIWKKIFIERKKLF